MNKGIQMNLSKNRLYILALLISQSFLLCANKDALTLVLCDSKTPNIIVDTVNTIYKSAFPGSDHPVTKTTLAVMKEDTPIGFIMYFDSTISPTQKTRYILNFAIHESNRNQGIGTQAMHMFEKQACQDHMHYLSLVPNLNSINFYTKLGYISSQELIPMKPWSKGFLLYQCRDPSSLALSKNGFHLKYSYPQIQTHPVPAPRAPTFP